MKLVAFAAALALNVLTPDGGIYAMAGVAQDYSDWPRPARPPRH